MICLLVLAFACGALSATTTVHVPDMSSAFQQAFAGIDIDGSGNATLPEFLAVFDKYDSNGDGKVSEAEYVAGTTSPKAVAVAVFKNIDSDNDGFILRTDVKNVLPAFDTDGDGVVSFAEFAAKYQKMFASMPNPAVGK